MLPEIKEFFETLDGGSEYYRAEQRARDDNPVSRWRDTFTAEQRAEFYAAEEKQNLAVLKVSQEMRERHALALDVLRNHDDKVIKWLMTDRVIARDYTGYRDQVLKSLPMTRQEIDDFGDRQGWSGDYARLLERAEKAGVLPELTPEMADVSELVNYLRNNYGGNRTSLTKVILRHLPAIIESVEQRKAEAAEAEKVKAETVSTETPAVDTTPADVRPSPRRVPTRNPDGTFAPAFTVSA